MDIIRQRALAKQESRKQWAKNNPARLKLLQKRTDLKFKVTVLRHYTDVDNEVRCRCCNERTIEFLTLDHINEDGQEHRKIAGSGKAFYRFLQKHNYPLDPPLQIMCMQCNWASRVTGKCPHKEYIHIEL